MLATLQKNPGALGQTITPPEEGDYGRRLQPVGAIGITGGREGEKERCLLSKCAGAETKPLVLKDIGKN